MTTQIIEPKTSVYNFQMEIPKELIGKKVAVSFEQKEIKEEAVKVSKENARAELDKFYDAIQLDFSNFKFNRDEANER
jgi:hypothetical protein